MEVYSKNKRIKKHTNEIKENVSNGRNKQISRSIDNIESILCGTMAWSAIRTEYNIYIHMESQSSVVVSSLLKEIIWIGWSIAKDCLFVVYFVRIYLRFCSMLMVLFPKHSVLIFKQKYDFNNIIKETFLQSNIFLHLKHNKRNAQSMWYWSGFYCFNVETWFLFWLFYL